MSGIIIKMIYYQNVLKYLYIIVFFKYLLKTNVYFFINNIGIKRHIVYF